MSLRWILVVLLLSAGGCATTLETVAVPANTADWKLGHASDRRGQTVAEYVPRNESIDNWTRLFTIQFLEGVRSSPAANMEQLRTLMLKRCPAVDWHVVAQDSGSILYEWKISGCGANADQHEIARLLRGNEGLHRIAYTERRSSMSPNVRERWLKALTEAYVEKDRKRVVVTP